MASRDRLSDLIVPLTAVDESPAARLRLSLQMADDGIKMMRQNLRRRFPHDSDREIDLRLSEWLQGAHEADGVWLRLAPERLGSL